MTSENRVPRPLRIITCVGTRPEVVKMKPVVEALRDRGVEVVEWCSGQSKDLTDANEVGWAPDWNHGLTEGFADCIAIFGRVIEDDKPAAVIVQGDTATAFACAQAAFLARVPVAHVEAGMRTYASEPWPEEAFRRQIAAVARWHFAPDRIAACNIVKESRLSQERDMEEIGVYIVGNTVIDTLPRTPFRVLATLHRRENWGARRQRALKALSEFDHSHDNLTVEIIKHPNGASDYAAVDCEHLLREPMPHLDLLDRIQHASVVVTDSGGVQEECAHFGTPCLVLRSSTERVALERTGAVVLVHPDDPDALQGNLEAILAKRRCYGSGDASEKIADILVRELTSLDTTTK